MQISKKTWYLLQFAKHILKQDSGLQDGLKMQNISYKISRRIVQFKISWNKTESSNKQEDRFFLEHAKKTKTRHWATMAAKYKIFFSKFHAELFSLKFVETRQNVQTSEKTDYSLQSAKNISKQDTEAEL